MLDTISAVFERYDIFLFVLIRMTGFVTFNPIFGRRNVSVMIRGALAFVLAVPALLAITSDPEAAAMQAADTSNVLIIFIYIIKEFAIGYLMGLIAHMFFAVIVVGGEMMDLQIGLAMSQIFDPGSNVQMPLSGNFHNVAFMLLFFLTNSHITLTGIAFLSFRVAPIGFAELNPEIAFYIARIFMEMFVLSIRMAFPIIAAELIMEAGVGLLMRAVPQINIFVIGLQLKILAGMSVMLACAPISVWFFDGVLGRMNDSVFEALRVLVH